MWLKDILAMWRGAGNAKRRSWSLRAVLRAWRRSGPVRTVAMLMICALLFSGVSLPFHGILLPVSMLFIGEAEFSCALSEGARPGRLIRWRLLNTLIASSTLLLVTGHDWVATAALGLFIVSCSGVLSGRGLAPVTVVASVANLALPMLVRWANAAPDPFVLTTQALGVLPRFPGQYV